MSLGLENVLRALHDRQIDADVEVTADRGMTVWIGDAAHGVRTLRTFKPHSDGKLVSWPELDTATQWLLDRTSELYPEGEQANGGSDDQGQRSIASDIGLTSSGSSSPSDRVPD
jgi:hypothetical protein